MGWQGIVFIIVASVAFSYSGYRIWVLFQILKSHNGTLASRFGNLYKRILTTIENVCFQRAVLRKRGPGIMHAVIFWGFLIISLGTFEQFCTTIHPAANFEFIGHLQYLTLILLQDLFTIGVLLAVGYAAYRRYIVRPEALGKSKDANIILFFIALLMVSIFLMNGFSLLGNTPWYSEAMPISSFVAKILAKLELSMDSNMALGSVFKWIHMLIVLGFAVYIPGSKHLHLIAAAPNTFLKTLSREKPMLPINFEDESVQQYGAAKITDLSWKDALDYYSCTECGRCQDLCPAYNTQKPLSPKMLIIDLKNNLYRNKASILANKRDEINPIIDEHITEEVIWACTSCRACEIACPVFIEHTDKIFNIRRNLVMMESRFPAEVQTVFKNMETNATPWAFSSADRAQWADGLGIKTMAENKDVDFLLWVGCAGAYDERNKKVMRAFVNILKKAGIKFAILGTEEQCTGDSARRIGNEYLFQTLAKANIDTLNRYGVKRIITACPHCFNTLGNEYKAFGGNYEVIHHSQFISNLIAEGKIKPNKSLDEIVVFHDSCYLGRWNNVYDEPRQALRSIPSVRVVEMSAHHDQGMCCGAGGGRMWMEENIGKRVNIARTEQAIATNAGVVASACPYCMTMLCDGMKSKDMQDKVRVLDIAELIDSATT
ncbi:MAG: (Fe-S)-binding protein [Candidatus Poribacteria bacterium]